jgi:monofunctional biosynthetic peptidoglycan transglycosylase
MRRRVLAGVGVLVLLLAPLLAVGPVVRAVARSKAADRGLELEIGSVRPGWFALSLSDVVVRIPAAPAIGVALDRVVVRVSPVLSLRGVDVDGGNITVQGSADAVMAQVKAWRDRQGARSGAASSSSGGLPIRVSAVGLVWSNLTSNGTLEVVGGSLVRRGGEQSVSFDRADLRLGWGRLQVGSFHAELGETPAGRALSRARAEQLSAELNLSAFKGEPEQGAIPTAINTPPAPLRPVLPSADAAKSKSKSLKGKSKKGKAALEPTHDAAEAAPVVSAPWQRLLSSMASRKWERLEALAERAKRGAERALAPGAAFDIPQVQLKLLHEGSALNVGPAPLSVSRTKDGVRGSFVTRSEHDGKQLAVEGWLPLAGDDLLELGLQGGPISLRALGVREGDMGLVGVDQTSLLLETRATVSGDGVVRLHASGSLAGLGISHPGLAAEPLTDIDLGWGGDAELDLKHQKLSVTNGELNVERVQFLYELALEAIDKDLKIELAARVPQADCDDLLGAAPRALLPDLEGLHLGGTFALDTSVSMDTRGLADTKVTWNWDNKCSVTATPEAMDPERFREPFTHVVLDAKGEETEFSTGPTTENWVPLDEISRHMETALIVCEDSRFWNHRGFDSKAIQDSIATNLKAGHFVRGASTLSMQLAKNLYLGKEKTLSRKLQQTLLTLLLEERMSKQDILELYLNVVEFGPGIYGIRQAAQHYFSAHPSELSLGQALFLASLLPSPKQNHFAADGTLRKNRATHLRALMRIAHKIHRITDEELEDGLKEELLLGQPSPAIDLPWESLNTPAGG